MCDWITHIHLIIRFDHGIEKSPSHSTTLWTVVRSFLMSFSNRKKTQSSPRGSPVVSHSKSFWEGDWVWLHSTELKLNCYPKNNCPDLFRLDPLWLTLTSRVIDWKYLLFRYHQLAASYTCLLLLCLFSRLITPDLTADPGIPQGSVGAPALFLFPTLL